MRFVPTKIDIVWLAEATPHCDERGLFARAWCAEEFAQIGVATSAAQTSLAWSRSAGTLRGLHYQQHPYWEEKVVRCVRGSAYVVAVDLRPDSPTHCQWTAIELSADNRRALVVGKGCAQGYQTLQDDTELLYQMSQPYVPAASQGWRFNDPAFRIDWPLPISVLSDRDAEWEAYRW